MAKGNGRLPPLNALRAFEAAARHLSFKKAALELHVTAGAVSHQVKLLEDHLGVALFKRLTRALELTVDAQAMLPKVREGLDSLASAVERVRNRSEACTLTVLAPPNFAARWLMPRLGRFTAAHPNLDLHLASRPNMIDSHDQGGVVAVSHDGGDEAPLVMVRYGAGRYPGAHVDQIFSPAYVPVSSPALLAGSQALRTPADLRFHTLLHDDNLVEEGARPAWSDWLEAAGITDIDATRGPHFSDASLAMEAAIEGLGVSLALKPLALPDVEAGRLAIPFDLAVPTGFSYYLVTPEAYASHRAATEFRAWVLEEAAAVNRYSQPVRRNLRKSSASRPTIKKTASG
jgi:LysR family glycine cleavage system transcriptional activator